MRDLEDKYNETAKAAKLLLREEEDATLVDELDDENIDSEGWWSSSY